MQTKTTFKFLGATLTSLMLTACGGGGGSALDNTINNGNSSSAANNNWKIGSGTGETFNAGNIGVTIASKLYIGGIANLNLTIVNDTNAVISDAVSVEFSSPCINSNKAKIVEGTKIDSKAGVVAAQYQSTSCVGEDVITATATYKNKTLSATNKVTINNIRLGLGNGSDFIATKLDLGSNYASLFADQTTMLTVNVVNDAGEAVPTSQPITFTSGCISAGTSNITGGNTVNSQNGIAKAEYKAGTCFGDDTIRASTTYAGIQISATAIIPKINNKRIGSGSGSNFTPGQLSLSTSTTLFEGDSTEISASIVNNQNNLVSQATQVTFDSPCITAGLSSIAGGNNVTSVNGVAKAQYKVGKCNIDDKVIATIANGNTSADAAVSVPLNTRRLGSGFGQDFINNGLEVGTGETALSPGSSTTITAYIVDTLGELVTDPMVVTFTSPCLSAGKSLITGGNAVTAVNGKVTATYTANGCAGTGGADVIKASTPFKTGVLSASGYVFVKLDAPQTISFVDASPSWVSLKATGGLETSTLRFRVLGQTGIPVKGICVQFSPSTNVGGLTLVPSKCLASDPDNGFAAATDANGYASTIIQAGTVPTAVRVTATVDNTISTQSSALAVTTGLPDQNSTSLALSELNPVGWEYDGVTSTATIRMADAFNNPVPDGTAVTFTTNGGSIDGSCMTTNGACSVTWRSQNPRPSKSSTATFSFTNITANDFTLVCSDGSKDCRNGRIKILATAIGNESFIDGNGTGYYDDISKDIFTNSKGIHTVSANKLPIPGLSNTAPCSPSVPSSYASTGINSCDDLREAYIDKNFNGNRDADEEFINFNANPAELVPNDKFDELPNGKYDGALCSGKAREYGDCTTNKVNVRDDIILTMASEKPLVFGPSSVNLTTGGITLDIPLLLSDINGNGMPKGTTFSVDTSNLVNATATLNLSGALPSSIEPTTFVLSVKSHATNTPSGTVAIKVVYGGVTTSFAIKVN